MTLTLHLGVLDVPYSHSPEGTTTGDVAEILEAKYHPMEAFVELHLSEIAEDLAQGFQGTLESILMGAPPPSDPFATGTGKIEDRFKQFLSLGEMEALGYPGVPTKAAIERRSSRFKTKRGPAQRPSFIETGQYQASFKAWIDMANLNVQAAALAYQGGF